MPGVVYQDCKSDYITACGSANVGVKSIICISVSSAAVYRMCRCAVVSSRSRCLQSCGSWFCCVSYMATVTAILLWWGLP